MPLIKREWYVCMYVGMYVWYKTKSLPVACPYVCLDLYNYPTDFDVFFSIE
jgi:hypothetical protein